MSNSSIIIDYLEKLIGNACDKSKYTDLSNDLIGEIDKRILNNLNCIKAGKSQQKVYVCGEYVYKSQSMEIQRKVIDVSSQLVKVDSFTMNIIMQHMMSKIYKDYLILSAYIEHPIENVCQDNKHLVLIYNKSNFGDFQSYLINKNDPDYIRNIGHILNKVMEVNDKLYELCQFQHCDMKCMQILLNKDSNGNITPILSDFDKSTITLLINGNPVRITLDIADTAATGESVKDKLFVNKGGAKVNKRKRKTNRKTNRKINTKRKSKSRKRKKKGGSVVSKIKEYGLKAINLSQSLKKKAYGKQGVKRFEEMPLRDNSFYNSCLLASMLLLYDSSKSASQDILLIDRHMDEKYKNLLDYIDMKKILNYREKYKDDFKKLSGNAIAADCVIGLKEKANRYFSQISLY